MHRESRGQASVSLVLLIGGIATAAVITIALVAIGAIASGYGAEQQQRARGAAMAGIEDAAIRLARNPSETGTWTLTVGNTAVQVTSAAPDANTVNVTAQATAGFRRVALAAVYSIDPITNLPVQVSLTPQ